MKLFMKEPMVKTRENCSSCLLQSGDGHKWGMGTQRHGHGDTRNTRVRGRRHPGTQVSRDAGDTGHVGTPGT